jgi:hypothetical protein
MTHQPSLPDLVTHRRNSALRPTVGYVDARHTSVERLVWLIEQKLTTTPGVTTSEPPVLRSPRTTEQQRELLALRPKAWEYLLYAGVLWQRRHALESKWRDHELSYASPTRQYLDNREAFHFVVVTSNDLQACGQNIRRMLDPEPRSRLLGHSVSQAIPYLLNTSHRAWSKSTRRCSTLRLGYGVSASRRKWHHSWRLWPT